MRGLQWAAFPRLAHRRTWHRDLALLVFTANLRDDFRSRICNRMDGNSRLEFIQESATSLSNLGSSGSIGSMPDLANSHHRKNDLGTEPIFASTSLLTCDGVFARVVDGS
jgi:hypothetical protein